MSLADKMQMLCYTLH